MKCERCECEIPEELYSITERGLMLSATGHWAPFSFCKSCKKELDSWFFEYGKNRCDERMNDNENKTTLSAEKTTITDTDLISRTDLLKDIADLKKSPWFNSGKNIKDLFMHNSYVERKEAIEIIEDLCIKKLPSVENCGRKMKGESE